MHPGSAVVLMLPLLLFCYLCCLVLLLQLGPDDVCSSVMLDLFVQMSSKAAFHELRTRQRLGYSVHLSSSSLHRQLALVVRVQSPTTAPDAIAAAVRAWMGGFRAELQELAQQKLDSHKQVCVDVCMCERKIQPERL